MFAASAVWILPAAARHNAPLDAVLNALTFRNIGPFRTAAWVTAIAVPEPRTIISTRSTRRRAAADCGRRRTPAPRGSRSPTASAPPSAPSRSRRRIPTSSGWAPAIRPTRGRRISGKGVFKSTDAGATWQFMGLPDSITSRASSFIRRTPTSSTSPRSATSSRGTTSAASSARPDGGKTWKKVLYVNDGVGAIDLVINRKTPAALYAAMYDKDRRPWQIVESGPESGVYRTEDGGDKWTKLGGGLPTGKIGRIGLDIYQKNPLDAVRAARESESAERGRRRGRRGQARRARRGAGWRRKSRSRRRHHRQRAVSHRRRRQDVAEGDATSTSPAARRRTRSTRSASTRTTTRPSS